MATIALALIPLAALNVPLLLFLCRKFELRRFWPIFGLEWAMYVFYALLVAAGFVLVGGESFSLEALQGIGFIAVYGMVLFAIPFAVLFFFLARWVERKLNAAGSE